MYRLVCDFVVGVYYVLDIELLWVFSLLFVFFFCFFFVLGGFFFLFFFFFSSRRRHTRFSRDGVQTCALPILKLEADLYDGVRNGEFSLHFQPITRSQSGAVVGVEALIRWRHPVHGLVPPATFIPRSEERRVGKEWRARW